MVIRVILEVIIVHNHDSQKNLSELILIYNYSSQKIQLTASSFPALSQKLLGL